MIKKVGTIFREKLSEVQSRVPVRIGGRREGASFSDIFEDIKSSNNSERGLPPATINAASAAESPGRLPLSLNTHTPAADAGGKYSTLISSAAKQFGIPIELIQAVIRAESNFDPNVVSHAGAMGLMQLMPATATMLGVNDAFDPAQNIFGGVKYLKQLLDKYGGDVKMALAAYNCGMGTLSRLGITQLESNEELSKLPRETQNYIKKILGSLDSS